MIKEFELKVGGKTYKKKLDLNNEEELQRELQMAMAGRQAMQQKAELEKIYEQEIRRLQDNPWEVLQELGFDPLELSESKLREYVQEQQKSPEQVERERIERELIAARKEAEDLKRRHEEMEFAKLQEQAAAAERQRAQQEQSSMRMRQAQEQEAVGRELEQVSRKSQAALARARVAAGEAGVAGASVQALMGDYMRQEAGYRAALLRQQELGAVATGLGLEQAGLASQQRLIGIRQPIGQPARPRGLGIQDVLSVASGGRSGYVTGKSLET